MDLDDLLGVGAPCKASNRGRKFAPGSSKPKIPKQEIPHPPPQIKPNDDVNPAEAVALKTEPSNGPVKMEVETPNGSGKMEVETPKPVPDLGDPMDIDTGGGVKEEVKGEEEVIIGEEENIVVRELDVFIVPSLDPNVKLHVLQYPLRPCWRPYELDERCGEVRVKPWTSEWEMDLSLYDFSNWDDDAACRMKIEKQMLSTRWQPCQIADYSNVLGVLIGNKFYLNPIPSVTQLRPSMEHLNPDGAKRKHNLTNDRNISVKKKPLESEEVKSAEEGWISLKYLSSKSDFSALYLQKMVAQETSFPIEFSMNLYDYMTSLCPVPSDEQVKNKGLSRRVLLSLPLDQRIKRLLLQGPPVQRFSALKHFAPDCSTEDLLGVLDNYGLLVQGLWAPKTSLVCKERVTMAARDFVLLLFSKNLVVSSSHFDVPIKLKEHMKNFRSIFAIERCSTKDWKFKEDRDSVFIELYPEVVQKQEDAWTGTEKKITDMISQTTKGASGIMNAIRKPPIAPNPGKSSNLDQGAPKGERLASSKRKITSETREALLKALPKVFQSHKVCSFEFISQALQDLAISKSNSTKVDPRLTAAASSIADASPVELQEVISEVATNIHGSYVLKSSPDHPEYNALRKVVIDLFMARGPNGRLKKAEVQEGARLALKREITTNEYNKVMTDFCESRGAAWMLKSGNGKL